MTYPFMRKLEPVAAQASTAPKVATAPPHAAPQAPRRMTAGMQDAYDKLRNNPGTTAGEFERRYEDTNLHKRLSELYLAGFINKGPKRHCKVSKRSVDTWSAKPSAT